MSDLRHDLEAFEADPSSEPDLRRLLAAAAEASQPEVAVAAWLARGRWLADTEPEAAARAYVEAGDAEREDRADLLAATEAYQRALELAPDDQHALHALALVLHQREAWHELVDLYRSRQRALSDPGRRATLHVFAAEILDERLGDVSAALDEVVSAVRVSPDNLRLLSRLMELGERARRAEDVAIALGEVMMQAEDAEVRAALSHQLALTYLGPEGDRARALSYLKSALYELGEDPDQLEDVEDATQVRERLDRLEARFSDSTRDRRVSPQSVRLERELARIHEQDRQDHRRALLALTRALEHAPEDRELQEEVMRLGLMADDLARVAETFERVVAKTDNALLKSFLRLRLGHLYGQSLRRPAEAVRVYSDLLGEDPGHTEARRRLEPLLERLGRRDEQVDLLEKQLSAPGGGDRVRTLAKLERLYQQLGRSEDLQRTEELIRIETGDQPTIDVDVAEGYESDGAVGPISGFHLQPRVQRLEAAVESPSNEVARRAFVELTRILIDEREDFEQAEALAERGLERFPEEHSLLELLEDVHRRQQRWDAVVSLLRRRLEISESMEGRLAVRKALAHLFEAKLDDKARALEVLAQAEEEGPFDLEVSRERERLLLERLDWKRLEKTLERRLAEVEAPRLSALTRTSLARLCYDVELDLERAWLLLQDALEQAPHEPDVLELAAEVAARRRDVERAVELYERLSGLLDGPRAAAALVAAGRLARSHLSDRDRAEADFESALAADSACRPAVEGLAELARERRDWGCALAWLVRAAELDPDEPSRAAHLAEAGRIADVELGDDQQAASFFESSLEVDPNQTELYAQTGALVALRDPGRAHVYFREASIRAKDPALAAEWAERAAVLAEEAGLRDAAIAGHRDALHWEPRRRSSLVRLAALLEAEAAWEEIHELASTYLLWHQDSGTDADRAAAFARMARAKFGLQEWEAAARFARQAVEIEPTAEGHALWAEALEKEERWEEAADARRRGARYAHTDAERVQALSRAGELFGEKARDPARAAVVLADALQVRPEDPDLCARLAHHRHLAGDNMGAADAYRAHAAQLEPSARAEALRVAASWAWSQNRRAAADFLKASLETELNAAAAFDLARLWEYDGEVEHVAPLLLAVGKAQSSVGRFEAAARAFAEAAEVASVRSFDGPRAVEACEAIRHLDGDGRWDVLRALVTDRRAEAYEISAEQAARAWLDVLGPYAGHTLALERIEQWLLRADRPRPAAFVRALRTDDPDAGPLLEAPEGHFDGFALPEDPLSRVLHTHGAPILDAVREGWRRPAPRRRLELSALPEAVSPVVRRALHRAAAQPEEIELYAVEGADAPVVPVWLDGEGALGVDVRWAESVAENDLAFHVGVAVGGTRPDVLPWVAIDPSVFIETLLGVLPQWPAHATPFDPKRAKRRARGLEKILSADAATDLVRALAQWEHVARRARLHAQAHCIASGLVTSLAWSTVRRQAQTLPLSGALHTWWPDVVRFATGKPFIGWACGLEAEAVTPLR